MHETDAEIDDSFLGALRAGVRGVDVMAILAVPVVLVGVFTLPDGVRRSLAFSYGDPTLLTAFSANFVHLGADHLLSNLVVYGLVVPLVYLLSVLSGRRRRFLVAFTTFLIAFPVALSLSNLAVSRPGGTVGFSGVAMAFVGFLPLALAGFVAARFDVDGELDLAGALFFAGLALVATLAVRTPVTLGVAAIAILAAFGFACSAVGRPSRSRPGVRAALQAGGYVELAAASLVLFAGLQVLAFPSDPVVDGAVVNLYVHLLGYALGFIASYATVHVSGRLARGSRLPTGSKLPNGARRPNGDNEPQGPATQAPTSSEATSGWEGSTTDWRPGDSGGVDGGPHAATD